MDWAAESQEISADGLTYTFDLRKGMAWSDGTPIDAATFAYSINRALDPCLASPVSYYLLDLVSAQAFNNSACPTGAIKSAATLIGSTIKTPDPLTLRLTLAHPAGYFLSALTSSPSWAVPQALVERYTQPRLPQQPYHERSLNLDGSSARQRTLRRQPLSADELAASHLAAAE